MNYEENDGLMWFLNAVNENHQESPIGAWFAIMEESARYYNQEIADEPEPDFCENSAVHAWLEWQQSNG